MWFVCELYDELGVIFIVIKMDLYWLCLCIYVSELVVSEKIMCVMVYVDQGIQIKCCLIEDLCLMILFNLGLVEVFL